jgi:hypothetical protein
MSLRILGAHPLARDDQGRLKSRIATIFPHARTLVTLPGIHATQREAFLEMLEKEHRKETGQPLSPDRRAAVWSSAVDLIMEDDTILIRPDPERVSLIFEADEALQKMVSKRQIRFLYAQNERVHQAVKRRGECWRITPLPKSPAEMQHMIRSAKIGIEGRDIYYYNNSTGTRWLTCQEFAALGVLEDDELRRHVEEIHKYSGMVNGAGNPEVDFFLAGYSMRVEFAACERRAFEAPQLRETYQRLRDRFVELVRPDLRCDDLDNIDWRRKMFAALRARQEDVVSEELLLGLSPEFYMQIEWLPGGRIETGEFIFDSVFDEPSGGADCPGPQCDPKARSFVFNFVRDFDDLEYVNVGRVVASLSYRTPGSGRRDVYVVEMKNRSRDQEIVKIIRMQKWGVWERLDDGQSLLQAILDTDEYTEYTLDRRLGCRRLGMRLASRFIPRKIIETYTGRQTACRGRRISSPYFERDYVHGIATDKIPLTRFEDQTFAVRFASLLGQAAVPNIVVGRCEQDGRVLFDDGDEVLIEDERHLPAEIIVTDHTGSFSDYSTDLEYFARQYALPISNRAGHVPDPAAFADAYAAAILTRFQQLQEELSCRSQAFVALFTDRTWDERGSFAFRWQQVLLRLDRTDPAALADRIRGHCVLP